MNNQVVFITGPARGIGAEVARAAAKRGAKLALAGLEPQLLEQLANELGPEHLWIECDVTSQASLARAVEATVQKFGGIDIVFANAGIACNGPVSVAPPDALARVVEVNLIGVIRTVSATLAHVTARKGYVLLMSSAASIVTSPGISSYAAAKAGVEHFANGLRLEVAHKGVAVGSFHPCWIATDLVNDSRRDLPSFDRMLAKLPGPFGGVTPVSVCAEAVIDAMVKRKRKAFVPRSLAPYAALRQFLNSRFGEFLLAREMRRSVPRLEREVQQLGRSFGEHSVEVTRK
ncbi:MAG TPA: SDR family oxidoreductase [Thermoanaerobaculia bacterium]|nr:SDR family oxidoreductase [Thermoanaerobaculia bacterium]